jgi:hypothetical protein
MLIDRALRVATCPIAAKGGGADRDAPGRRISGLYLRLFRHFQRIDDLDAQVPDGTFQLSVA